MNKRKIILDCDPGHDDAIAIMVAGKNKYLDILGITVVSGNQTLEKTGLNALNLCQYLKLDVPVCLGSSRPIIKEVEVCADIHGETGLDGFEFPKLEKKFHKDGAVDFIINTLMSSKDKITVVTTGPMTNLALAMRIEPKIIDSIEEVILMGGAYTNGNVSPAAEFNIYSDPEAAYIVFNSKCKVTMIGLDVTRKVLVLPNVIERMERIDNIASRLFVKLMKVYNENQRKVFGLEGGPMHDPVTIAYLLNPEVLTVKYVNCEIDIDHGTSYGRTNCDIFDYMHKEKNTFVATDIDVEEFWNIIEAGIKSYS